MKKKKKKQLQNMYSSLESSLPEPGKRSLSEQDVEPVNPLDISLPEPVKKSLVEQDVEPVESLDSSLPEPVKMSLWEQDVEPVESLDSSLPEPVKRSLWEQEDLESQRSKPATSSPNEAISVPTGTNKEAEADTHQQRNSQEDENVNISKNLPYWLVTEILKYFFVKADLRSQLFYIYTAGGFYRPYSILEFRVWLNSFAQGTAYAPKLSTSVVNEIFQRLLTTPGIQTTMDELDPNQVFVNTLNYVVNVKTGEVCAPSPDYLFINALQGRYLGKDAPPPELYLSWLRMIVPDETELQKLLAIISYMISNFHQAKKFFFIYGARDSGKSGLLYLIEKFVGENLCSHIALEDLSDPHCSSELYGMKINTCGEREPGKVLKNTKVIKAITGGDMIDANPKLKKHFKYRGKTKISVLGNKAYHFSPQVDEDAFWSRLFPFEVLVSIPASKQIPGFKEILFNQERDQILTYHLNHMQPFIEGDNFVFPAYPSTERLKAQLQRKFSSVNDFGETKCKFDCVAWASEDQLYEAYIEFCSKNRLSAVSKIIFGKELKVWFPFLQPHKGYEESRPNAIQGFRGICLRKDGE